MVIYYLLYGTQRVYIYLEYNNLHYLHRNILNFTFEVHLTAHDGIFEERLLSSKDSKPIEIVAWLDLSWRRTMSQVFFSGSLTNLTDCNP